MFIDDNAINFHSTKKPKADEQITSTFDQTLVNLSIITLSCKVNEKQQISTKILKIRKLITALAI